MHPRPWEAAKRGETDPVPEETIAKSLHRVEGAIADAGAPGNSGVAPPALGTRFRFTTEEGERRPENLYPDRKKKSRQNKAGRVGSPSSLEILKERQKAMEAAASLSGSDYGSAKQSQEDPEHSESEQESEFSHSSDKHGPDVTPGTSDCII
ncbi:hypothetical protein NDU88_005246 [Pleurodeles waltl]|uniref:Uncharacterized protein n=1 Tax=Pleurodeles waltl TaxID=8319 RepID=A0AAV7T9V2_PLEWA|nr:hypothetical protein NDU88_005246 [Pleurodeles waltl]